MWHNRWHPDADADDDVNFVHTGPHMLRPFDDDAAWLAAVLSREGRRLGFGTAADVDDVTGNLWLQWPGAEEAAEEEEADGAA